ncbi:TolC family protein, partial [Acinetobacter baumannii]
AELDVLRADARLAATAASVPQLQAEAERARHRIATLLGQRPEELTVDLSPRDLPAITKALPIGDPGELLRRRPDIRAAERRLAASTADVGVATADLFPRVSLSGFLGFTAGRGSQIGSSAARAWSVGPSISWAAFDLGSVRARLRGAKADADAALASYEQQVLLALEESANAFSDYGKRQERLVSLVRQSEASRAAAQQAAIRYREGTTDFLVLLDAEREQLSAEDAQAQAEVERALRNLSLYQFRACPFCVKTRRAMHRLNLPMQLKDAMNDPQARQALLEGGGKVKVPCLRIEENGQVRWMYESSEIIAYLEGRFANA